MNNKFYVEDTSIKGRKEEINLKTARVISLLEEEGLDALYLTRQSNFAWITAGGSNIVTICTQDGVASVLITKDGKRFIITSKVEENRLRDEQYLDELGFTILSQEWYEDRNEEYIVNIAGSLDNVGSDIQIGGIKMIQDKINQLNYSLTHNEICRYQYLGDFMSEALEAYIATLKPGMTEYEIAGGVANALWAKEIDQVLFIVATDDRILHYRHPVPTSKKLEKSLMISCNGRYKGLITSTTRMAYFGTPPVELLDRYKAVVEIENLMIEATKPGVDDLVPHMAGKQAYKDFGYEEMYYRHHQGGAQGYFNRNYLVSPNKHEITKTNQCYCYNPVIDGAKTEDAFIATENGPLMITKPISFPVLTSVVNGVNFDRPGMLIID